MSELTVTRSFRVRRDRHGRKRLKAGEELTLVKIPRIARLMALAIRFEQLIRKGVVADQAELSRRGNVSRARITQIMDLSLLAPQIQEELLNANGDTSLCELTERGVRTIAGFHCWEEQLTAWQP